MECCRYPKLCERKFPPPGSSFLGAIGAVSWTRRQPGWVNCMAGLCRWYSRRRALEQDAPESVKTIFDRILQGAAEVVNVTPRCGLGKNDRPWKHYRQRHLPLKKVVHTCPVYLALPFRFAVDMEENYNQSITAADWADGRQSLAGKPDCSPAPK